MASLAIILARGGSKGVPRKNIRQLAGRPCIAWTIDDALGAASIDHCVVSSDDHEILTFASQHTELHAIDRPADLASDTARIDDAARHALDAFSKARDDIAIGTIVILYANVPVRPAGLIDRATSVLRNTGCDSVQSYAPVGKHHPWWTCVVEDNASVRAFDGGPLYHNTFRRQDLPPAHIPDGGVIALTPAALRLELADVPEGPHQFLGLDRRGVLTGEDEVVDIDAEHDFVRAEAKLAERLATRDHEGVTP
jgi:CMP-N-acetylneuraminic acid synthetase